eukprot:scaffold412_cov311-Pavlova_lutheri.AAC.21
MDFVDVVVSNPDLGLATWQGATLQVTGVPFDPSIAWDGDLDVTSMEISVARATGVGGGGDFSSARIRPFHPSGRKDLDLPGPYLRCRGGTVPSAISVRLTTHGPRIIRTARRQADVSRRGRIPGASHPGP